MKPKQKIRSIQIISNRFGVNIHLYRQCDDDLFLHIYDVKSDRLSSHTRNLIDLLFRKCNHPEIMLFANSSYIQATFIGKVSLQ